MSDSGSGARQFRLVVVGSGRVGKTSLVWRFVHGRFCSHYQPTIEDSYRQLIQLPDGRYKSVEILDTAGMHQFPAMRDLSIKSSQCFVIVFAINSRQSFNEAEQLITHIFDVKGSRDVPLVLVGNKRDLDDTREVSADEGLHLAAQSGCSFVETSAKCDVSVSDVFSQLLTRGFQQVPVSRSSSSIGGATTITARGNDDDEGTLSGGGLPPRTGSCTKASSSRRRTLLGRSRSAGIVTTASVVSNSNSISSLFSAMTTGGGRSARKKKSLEGGRSEGPEVDRRRSDDGKKRKRTGGSDDERKEGRCVLL